MIPLQTSLQQGGLMTKVAENGRVEVEMGDMVTCLYQAAGADEDKVPMECRQNQNMASMNIAVSTIASAVEEIKDGQKQVIQLMEKVAIQGERVNNLATAVAAEVADRKHVNDILFERVHTLEVAPVEVAKTRQSGLWGAVSSALIAAMVAIIIAVAKH